MEFNGTKIAKVCMVGIGGIGISALAKLFHARGITVMGINDDREGVTISSLQALGIEILFKDTNPTLPEADIYVYSDAWHGRGPEVIESARATGKPVMSYFEALGVVARNYRVIAIAGVHGKTTTTAMVGTMLVSLGFDPTIVVGSFVTAFGSNFRAGGSEWLVVEADEYMRHFLNFNPEITIITNIEADHLDYYRDLADVEDAFQHLVSQTKNTVICNPHDASVAKVITGSSCAVVDYTACLSLVPKLRVPGEHNRLDAGCAYALGQTLGLTDEGIATSLGEFTGTARRLELIRETKQGTLIYDDYAHHPTEIRASLSALRELYPDRKIIVIFQPHLYSRTRTLFDGFTHAFADATSVYMLPIYPAREPFDPNISSEKVVTAMDHAESHAVTFDEVREVLQSMTLDSNTVIVTMGAGEAYKVCDVIQ